MGFFIESFMEKHYFIPKNKLVILENVFNMKLTSKIMYDSVQYNINYNPWIFIQTTEKKDIIITFSKDMEFNDVLYIICRSNDLILRDVESNAFYYFLYIDFVNDLENITI